MRLALYFFFACYLAFSCFALDSDFSKICSEDVTKNICDDYIKRGLDFTICSWRYFLPSFNVISDDDQDKVYTASMPHCDLWENSERPSLIPDVEGSYCLDNGQNVNLKDLSLQDPKRAAMCARYKLAEIYWQEEALKFFSGKTSQQTVFNFVAEYMRICMEKKALQNNHGNLLDSPITFPGQKSYWPTSALNPTGIIMGFGILYVGKWLLAESEK